jgi:hypothetical protein
MLGKTPGISQIRQRPVRADDSAMNMVDRVTCAPLERPDEWNLYLDPWGFAVAWLVEIRVRSGRTDAQPESCCPRPAEDR